jgi:hypothetical protein
MIYFGVQGELYNFEPKWLCPYKSNMINVSTIYNFRLLKDKGPVWQLPIEKTTLVLDFIGYVLLMMITRSISH